MQARKPRLLVHILNHQRLLPFIDPTHGRALWREFAEGLSRLARRLTDMQAHETANFVVEKNAQENEIHDGTEFVRQTAKQFLYARCAAMARETRRRASYPASVRGSPGRTGTRHASRGYVATIPCSWSECGDTTHEERPRGAKHCDPRIRVGRLHLDVSRSARDVRQSICATRHSRRCSHGIIQRSR